MRDTRCAEDVLEFRRRQYLHDLPPRLPTAGSKGCPRRSCCNSRRSTGSVCCCQSRSWSNCTCCSPHRCHSACRPVCCIGFRRSPTPRRRPIPTPRTSNHRRSSNCGSAAHYLGRAPIRRQCTHDWRSRRQSARLNHSRRSAQPTAPRPNRCSTRLSRNGLDVDAANGTLRSARSVPRRRHVICVLQPSLTFQTIAFPSRSSRRRSPCYSKESLSSVPWLSRRLSHWARHLSAQQSSRRSPHPCRHPLGPDSVPAYIVGSPLQAPSPGLWTMTVSQKINTILFWLTSPLASGVKLHRDRASAGAPDVAPVGAPRARSLTSPGRGRTGAPRRVPACQREHAIAIFYFAPAKHRTFLKRIPTARQPTCSTRGDPTTAS
jgi:hypothetical protein